MKTPWMQTNYKQLDDNQYSVQVLSDGEVVLSSKDKMTSFTLSNNAFEEYKSGHIDNLMLENM